MSRSSTRKTESYGAADASRNPGYPDGWGKFIPWPACCTVQTAAVRCTFTAPEMEIARQTFPVLVMAKSPLAVNAPVDTGSMLIRS